MPSQVTPPSSTSSNGASPDAQQFRVVRKRNRIPLSCAPCRHRKLKCNRAHPCDNCTKRGDTASCNYATPGNRRKAGAAASSSSPEDMQNRIDRLESLVLSLMSTGGSQPTHPGIAHAAIDASRSNSMSVSSERRYEETTSEMIPEEDEDGEGEDSEVEQVSKGIGIMKVEGGRAYFASDSHWWAILGEINEVKKYFESHKEDYKRHLDRVKATKPATEEPTGTAFLLQGQAALDPSEVLAAFPSKADADRMITRYFNAYDPSVHIVHGPTFQKQYDKHWLTPQDSSIAWIGMCFAMMTLALQSYRRAGDEPPELKGRSQELAGQYRRLTAQCLTLADITQPVAQVLETFVLHIQAEQARTKDAEPGLLFVTSLCVRLAMRMGYHRDPAPYPQITPFQGEMRRRVFAFVRHCDLLISFQFGLPAMIRHDQIDTELPRNLFDDELSEEMTALPAERPMFFATPMSYMIAKSKMTFIFGKIVERVGLITGPPTYDETMKFDQELREARETHPPLLRMRSFQESARDPANLIIQRLSLEMVFLRSLFVLHRRFIARGRENPRYAYSRRTCIDASMQLLEQQSILHEESKPGGRLRSVKWYINSVTTHDFLLAGMMVCLDLYHSVETERKGRRSLSGLSSSAEEQAAELEARREMMRRVEQSITIWDSIRDYSVEAYKASGSLRVMVDKLKAHQGGSMQDPASFTAVSAAAPRPASPPVPVSIPSKMNAYGFDQGPRSGFGMFPNGETADVDPDDLAAEQSAAMTLGLLSSGGLSPAPNFSLNTSAMNNPSSGMMPGSEHTGLTPGYSGPELNSAGIIQSGGLGPASPFSNIFGQSTPGFMGMEGIATELDWGAWDNYIASNTAMDPSMSIWPMGFDFAAPGDLALQQTATGAGAGAGVGNGVGPEGSGGRSTPLNNSAPHGGASHGG